MLIRSVEDFVHGRGVTYDLRYNCGDRRLLWTDSHARIFDSEKQEGLFLRYNQGTYTLFNFLGEHIRNGQRISVNEISGFTGINYGRLLVHTRRIFGRRRRDELLSFDSSVELISKVVPLVEGWQTVTEVGSETGISRHTVKQYARNGLIEAWNLDGKYYVSPVGKEKLLRQLLGGGVSVHPAKNGWLRLRVVADNLHTCISTLESHCNDGDIECLLYGKKRWYVSPCAVEELRDMIRPNDDTLVHDGRKYYSLTNVARESAALRGIESREGMKREVGRISALVLNGSVGYITLGKTKRKYFDGETKKMLSEAARCSEISDITGLAVKKVSRLFERGELRKIELNGKFNYASIKEVRRLAKRFGV